MFKILTAALAIVIPSGAMAAPTIYYGSDDGATSSTPRPKSAAAAARFDAAARLIGYVNFIDFETAPIGAFSSLSMGGGVIMTGRDSRGNSQTVRDSPFGTPEARYNFNTTASGKNSVALFGGTVTFTFDTPTQAFGAYFTGAQRGGIISYSDGTTQEVGLGIQGPGGGAQFVGFTDVSALISSITFNAFNDVIGFDDVRFIGATPAPTVPEPATWALMLVGFGLVGAASRYRRRNTNIVYA